jgi:hypothetical protein
MPDMITSTNLSPIVKEVQDQYMASFVEKDRLGLHELWAKCEDYWGGKQNPPKKVGDKVSPASVTNVIMPNVESMVADLVMEPLEITLTGWTTSERAVAPRGELAMQWVWEKNKMTMKRDRFERQRSKFGTGIWKVYFDGQAHGMIGMPVVEPVNPANFFPDPKVRSYDQLHMADYIIHAVPRARKYLGRVYGEKALQLETPAASPYNPEIFGDSSAFDKISNDKVLVLERWTVEKGGRLRKVVVADNVVLYDSDEDGDENQKKKGFYALNRYPFVVVPCYQREGMLWGIGDVEYLMPTQDLINDLDDQIRMNARLMGNIQKVIAIASGINPQQWTNEPGLNIPARDINGFKIVQPPNMPMYVLNRRGEALNSETQLITGRTDAVEGRRPGSVRAASAIVALQEAGLRRVNHKKMMAQQGLSEVFSIVLDFITEYWDTEVEIGEEVMNADGGESSKPVMFSGKELRDIPILTGQGIPLLDDKTGQPMTQRASFDVTVNIGAGFISSKSYIYQATLELAQAGLITKEEGRAVLKQILSWPIIDPWNPVGEFAAKQGIVGQPSPEQQQSVVPPEAMAAQQAGGGMMPPEMMAQLVNSMGGGNMPNG